MYRLCPLYCIGTVVCLVHILARNYCFPNIEHGLYDRLVIFSGVLANHIPSRADKDP